MGEEYRVAKGPRELPCCGKNIRVKIAEPGIQWRHCPRHDETHYFELVPLSLTNSKTLRLRWVDEEYAKEKLAGFNGHDPDEFSDVTLEDL